MSTIVYGLTLLLAAALVSGLWRYALAERLVRSDVHDEELQRMTARLGPSLAATWP